jgi:tetratricopeptide (TPR) repeat protein
MALRRPTVLIKLSAPVIVFLALLAVLTLVNRSDPAPLTGAAGRSDAAKLPNDTRELIETLQAAVRARPDRAEGYAELGDAYLQRSRETGDPSLYARAERSFEAALKRDRRNVTATIGSGTLALARHDFAEGLRLGRRALELAPGAVRPYGVIVDSQIELGRYRDAARSLQRMVDLKPNLASYSRVSYYRELTGDLRGAVEAMALAVSAGAGAPENVAYVQTLLGDLELDRGRVGAAATAYGQALAGVGGYLPARAGLARVEIARGRLGAAARRLRSMSELLPAPTYLVTLAEIELAMGRKSAAEADLDLVRAQRRLLSAAGTRADVELVLFEANHGDPARAVRTGRDVYRRAPSVRSADALGWALTRAGDPRAGLRLARQALRLGSRDPAFHYHRGIAAAAAGRPELAQRELRRALSLNPSFSPYHAARARRALRSLER